MKISFDKWRLLLEVSKELKSIHRNLLVIRCDLALLHDMIEAIGEGVSPEVVARVQALAADANRRTEALKAAIAANTPEKPGS